MGHHILRKCKCTARSFGSTMIGSTVIWSWFHNRNDYLTSFNDNQRNLGTVQ